MNPIFFKQKSRGFLFFLVLGLGWGHSVESAYFQPVEFEECAAAEELEEYAVPEEFEECAAEECAKNDPYIYDSIWWNPYSNEIATNLDDCCIEDCDQPYANNWLCGAFLFLRSSGSKFNTRFSFDDSYVGTFDSLSHFNPKWDFGFRIAGGHDFPACGFGLAASWTHFINKCRGTLFNHSAHWKLRYDIIDLQADFELGLFPSFPSFKLDPFAGMQIALIDQLMHIRAPAEIPVLPFINNFVSLPKISQHFCGVGPRIGLDAALSDIYLFCGWDFSLIAKLAGEVLYDCHRNGHWNTRDLSKGKHERWIWAVDAAIGTQFQFVGLTLDIGFEYHRYFNLMVGGNSDLQIYGANTSLSVNF